MVHGRTFQQKSLTCWKKRCVKRASGSDGFQGCGLHWTTVQIVVIG
jgi:hypothetical protein